MKVKVHCACETRFEFEVEPVNSRMPVAIACPGCGADATELANEVIRLQLGANPPPAAPIVAKLVTAQPAPASAQPAAAPKPAGIVARPVASAPAAPAAPRIAGNPPVVTAATPAVAPPSGAPIGLRKAAHGSQPQAAAAAEAAPAQTCPKHPHETAVDTCRVCRKPICEKCMQQFGYVCSVFCREQASGKKIAVPAHMGQKRMYEDQGMSKKVKLIALGATLLVIVGASVGIWYTYVAREPKVMLSVTLPVHDREELEATEYKADDHYELIGPNRLLALKEKRVSLMDVSKKEDLWATPLQTEAESAAEKAAKDKNADIVKNAPLIRDGDGRVYKRIQGLDPVAWRDEQELSNPRVLATTNDVWLVFRRRLFRLDRQTGAKKDLNIADQITGLTSGIDCILVTTRSDKGARGLIRIALADGSQQTEEISPAPVGRGSGTNTPGARSMAAAATTTNRPAGNTMTPATGTRGTTPGARAAAPTSTARAAGPGARGPNAVGTALRTAGAATGTGTARPTEEPDFMDFSDSYSEPYIPAGPNVVEFKTRLLQRRTTERQAMRPAPAQGTSVLDDKNLTASRGIDLAEEMMNQSQREATGGVELQNVSRYEVTLHRRFASGVEDWKGEIIGQPAFVPLETVDLVTGFTNVIAFDKSNKKLWEAKLTFPVTYFSHFYEDLRQPALETKDAIYFADKGMVTRFDKDTGNARWRYNTVGVTRINTDAKGDIYVDTSTANVDTIKFSQDVSFRDKAELQIVKLEAATGKKLWENKFESDQYQARPSGKFLFSTRTWQVQDALKLEEGPDRFFNIKLVSPSSGNAIWTYPVLRRVPRGAQIQDKWILLRFHDRILVLNFFSL